MKWIDYTKELASVLRAVVVKAGISRQQMNKKVSGSRYQLIASSLQAPCKPVASRYIFIASHEIVHG